MNAVLRMAIYVILIGSLFGLLINHAQAFEYKANFDKIPAINDWSVQVATWKRTPTVIICDSAPLTKADANKAVKFWQNLGHRFFRTQYKYDPMDKCNQATPVGYITVHLATQDSKLGPDVLAETHFFIDNDHNEVEWAIIYMKKDIKETVLEHELGHALGFLHYNKINHLMNPKWLLGGWDTEGLSR